MAGEERGLQPPFIGVLWDAAPVGCSKSVSAVSHGIQVFRMVIWAVAKGERGRWPFGVVNHVVLWKGVDGRGHSSGEFSVSQGHLVS